MALQKGSIVFHRLQQGPGIVVDFMKDHNGKDIAKVLWQSIMQYSYHSVSSLKLEHEAFPTDK